MDFEREGLVCDGIDEAGGDDGSIGDVNDLSSEQSRRQVQHPWTAAFGWCKKNTKGVDRSEVGKTVRRHNGPSRCR